MSVTDRASNDLISLVVKDGPAEGDDGELYKAMGHVCKSERKSGLHRAPAAPRTASAALTVVGDGQQQRAA